MRSLAITDAVSAAGARMPAVAGRLAACAVIGTMVCTALPGCGQKGPLRLPTPLAAVSPPASSASATAPTGFPSASQSR